MSDGLDGVVACQTVLSHNDGETGLVLVRGHPIAELVAERGYEGTVALMWDGFAGENLTREDIIAQLGAGRRSTACACVSPRCRPTARQRKSSLPCRSALPRCCVRAKESRRCRPTLRSPPRPISCAWRVARRWKRASPPPSTTISPP